VIQRLVTALLVLLAVGFAVAGIDLTLLLLGLGSIPAFMGASAGTVMDATGAAWNTHALYGSAWSADRPATTGGRDRRSPGRRLDTTRIPGRTAMQGGHPADGHRRGGPYGRTGSFVFVSPPTRTDGRPEERLHAAASMGMSHDHRLRRHLGMRISSKRTGGGLRVAATVGSRVRRLLALDTRKEAW
jgi:hypothetical protein